MGESSFLWLRVAAGLHSLGLLEAIVTVMRRRESLFRVALAAFGLGALFQLVSIVIYLIYLNCVISILLLFSFSTSFIICEWHSFHSNCRCITVPCLDLCCSQHWN